MTDALVGGEPAVDVEENDANDQNDSTFGDDAGSTNFSLTSSITDFPQENGRSYHSYKAGKYALPNDEDEQDRLDLQHHLSTKMLGGLFLAPITQDPHRILDVGTGTGIWATEVATEYPAASVIGNDLSPIQPTFVPPNCQFEVDDAEDEWPYHTKFDFVHMRMLVGSIGDWRRLFRQSFDHITERGWLEVQDISFPICCDDGSLTQNHDLYKWSTLLIKAFEKANRPLTAPTKHKERMVAAGFVDVHETIYQWPINQWPEETEKKELGKWEEVNFLEGLPAFTLGPFTRHLGWSKDEVEVFMSRVRNDIKNKEIHAYFKIYVVYGQKPVL